MKKILLFLLLFFAIAAIGFSQNPQFTPDEIRAEIQRRGLDPAAVEAQMKQRGFDLYQLQPEQVPAAQVAFNEVAKELEAAKPAEPSPANEPEKPTENPPGGQNPPGTTSPNPPGGQNPPGTTSPSQPGGENPPSGGSSPASPPSQNPSSSPSTVPAKPGTQDTIPPSSVAPQDTLSPAPTEPTLPEETPQPNEGSDDVSGQPGSSIFGQQIFRSNPIEVYQQTADAVVPNDYVLGVGDKMVVSVWGNVANYTESLEVNAEGYVAPKTLPRVYLRGSTLAKAKAQLRAVFAQRYPVGQSNFEVSLSTARSIDVTITGEVFKFGSFKVSALNNAFRTLVVSGGPTNNGTLRNITLYRSGKPKRTIDVYQYILNPQVGNNFYLENGDVIHVGPAERVVRVSGGVKRPFRYELLPGENLTKLIEWAGGLRQNAYLGNIQIERLAGQKREIIDINLKELLDNKRDLPLLDGDVITIKELVAEVENFAEVSGAVEYPDRYALVPGTRVADLIAKAKLKKDARRDFAALISTRVDGLTEYTRINLDSILVRQSDTTYNILLKPKDRITVFPSGKYLERPEGVQSEGAVRDPRGFPFDYRRTLRVSDLVLLSGGLKPDATDFAFITRTYPDRPKEVEHLRIPLRAALENPGGVDDILLEPGDRLFVPNKAVYLEAYTVQSQGAVRSPREMPIDSKKSVKVGTLVEMSNGLTPEATDFGYIFRRYPDRPKEQSTIRVDLREVLSNPESPANLALEPGDRLFVPNKSNFREAYTVQSQGAVRNPQNFPADYTKTMRVSNLVELSNGLQPDATDFGYIFRIYPDRPKEQTTLRVDLRESLLNPGSTADLALEPGDRLFVPNKGTFRESYSVSSEGAVRNSQTLPIDYNKTLRVSNLIELSSGLQPDATDFGYIFRTYPDRPKEQTTLRVNVREAVAKPGSATDFSLEPGDRLFVPNKGTFREAYTVQSQGAVRNPRSFPATYDSTLRVSNLIELSSGLQPDAVEFAYIFRTYPDRPKEQSTFRVNLKSAMQSPGSSDDVRLEPGDRLFIPNKNAYREAYSVQSQGAFRNPSTFPIDMDKTLRISNLIELSNGLQPDATDFAYIFRTYPDRPKEQTYVRVNLKEAMQNPGSPADLALEPNDRLLAMSRGLFMEEYSVRVTGAVRKQGSYRWDPSLRMEDLITLAGGLLPEAASNRVEVFRVTINQNRPTQVSAGIFEIDDNFHIKTTQNFVLMPHDIISVRTVPNFELQKMVTLQGEVRYPGEYALIGNNERVASVIERAGGLAPESFPEGATLYRQQDSIGYIVLNLNKALGKPASHLNMIMREGDIIYIPKQKELVSITGDTKAAEIYPDKIIGNGGKINVAYKPGKRARYYIRKFAAGFGEKADRNNVTVEKPNGQIKSTRRFLFFRIYPKVPKGGIVSVTTKPPEPVSTGSSDGVAKAPPDWDKIFADTMTKVTSIATLLLLIKNL